MKPRELFTTQQIADMLHVHRNTLARAVKAGNFPPPITVLGRPRWRGEDVDAYFERQTKLARGEARRGRNP